MGLPFAYETLAEELVETNHPVRPYLLPYEWDPAYEDQTDADIDQEYDAWYWNTMSLVMAGLTNRSPIETLNNVTIHSSVYGYEYLPEDGWRAHHYFMLSAIERNSMKDEIPHLKGQDEIWC
jgi:hypothetical protein